MTLLSSKFPLILKIPPFSYSPCPGHRLTRRMQRFTNQFVSRCSPFPYCESHSLFASSLVGAFLTGKRKHFRCFPNPLFSLWLILQFCLLTSWCKRAQENLCTFGIGLFHPRFLFCNSLFTSSLQKEKSKESKVNLRRMLVNGFHFFRSSELQFKNQLADVGLPLKCFDKQRVPFFIRRLWAIPLLPVNQ